MNNQTAEKNIIDRIHNIDSRFNRLFSVPLQWIGLLITCILFISPYWGRVAFAFFINIFFNRPKVYLNLVLKRMGKVGNHIMIGIFYFTLFALYAIFYKIFYFIRKKKNAEGKWVSSAFDKDTEEYYYQS